ncbi:MAG: hypothetical protein M3N93_01330 [Acidobacteriota bacterium]|nr:hypothetical protein [Acidobacteriota bacterium]
MILKNKANSWFLAVLGAFLAAGAASGQGDPHAGHAMAGMNMVDMNPASMFLMNMATGTSANAAAWRMPMVMTHFGSWNTMFMGVGFVIDTQQAGPRGGDKFYSSNWLMAAAEHRLGSRGAFQTDFMLSLEPASITGERYPLLFQTGETAYGKAIVDGQHPHNFIMSLGFHYAYQLSENTTLSTYFAPVGDPALGPVAFPHRASAMELPEATLSHHWQDSTHIADDVVTVGVSYKRARLEASGFHGAEPGENRWIVQAGGINSWATRLWFFPTKNWAAQVSVGRIVRPEALEPGDQVRATASLQYIKSMPGGSWASTFVWGRNHSTATLRNLNSYLVESVLPVTRKNFITGRAELVDKDELFGGDGRTFRIGAYTLGYTRDVALFRLVETGVGANFTTYSLPDAIKPYYGSHPVGGNMFIRFRLRPRD